MLLRARRHLRRPLLPPTVAPPRPPSASPPPPSSPPRPCPACRRPCRRASIAAVPLPARPPAAVDLSTAAYPPSVRLKVVFVGSDVLWRSGAGVWGCWRCCAAWVRRLGAVSCWVRCVVLLLAAHPSAVLPGIAWWRPVRCRLAAPGRWARRRLVACLRVLLLLSGCCPRVGRGGLQVL